jgi:signal transduction histidine kinase
VLEGRARARRDVEIAGTHPEADGIRIEGVMQPTISGVLLRGPGDAQDPIVVVTNAAHVETILQNLTTNAIRATAAAPTSGESAPNPTGITRTPRTKSNRADCSTSC